MWYPQGRTLGGSTSINAMIYIRGQREDYEAWAELGNADWGYEQVLPFFRRAEANERLNDRYHSSVGAVNVTEQVQHNPLSKAFVRAAQELGVPFIARLQRSGAGGGRLVRRHPEERPPGEHRHRVPQARPRPSEPHRPDPRARPEDPRRERPRRRTAVPLKGKPVEVRVDRELILSSGAVNSPAAAAAVRNRARPMN